MSEPRPVAEWEARRLAARYRDRFKVVRDGDRLVASPLDGRTPPLAARSAAVLGCELAWRTRYQLPARRG